MGNRINEQNRIQITAEIGCIQSFSEGNVQIYSG